VIGTGAAAGVGVREGFGAGCFLATASAGEAEDVGRGDGALAVGAGDAAGAGRDAGDAALAAGARCTDAVDVPGSGVMILTGGVEAELGNSALVGLPVGTPGTSAATGIGGCGGGAIQVGA